MKSAEYEFCQGACVICASCLPICADDSASAECSSSDYFFVNYNTFSDGSRCNENGCTYTSINTLPI